MKNSTTCLNIIARKFDIFGLGNVSEFYDGLNEETKQELFAGLYENMLIDRDFIKIDETTGKKKYIIQDAVQSLYIENAAWIEDGMEQEVQVMDATTGDFVSKILRKEGEDWFFIEKAVDGGVDVQHKIVQDQENTKCFTLLSKPEPLIIAAFQKYAKDLMLAELPLDVILRQKKLNLAVKYPGFYPELNSRGYSIDAKPVKSVFCGNKKDGTILHAIMSDVRRFLEKAEYQKVIKCFVNLKMIKEAISAETWDELASAKNERGEKPFTTAYRMNLFDKGGAWRKYLISITRGLEQSARSKIREDIAEICRECQESAIDSLTFDEMSKIGIAADNGVDTHTTSVNTSVNNSIIRLTKAVIDAGFLGAIIYDGENLSGNILSLNAQVDDCIEQIIKKARDLIIYEDNQLFTIIKPDLLESQHSLDPASEEFKLLLIRKRLQLKATLEMLTAVQSLSPTQNIGMLPYVVETSNKLCGLDFKQIVGVIIASAQLGLIEGEEQKRIFTLMNAFYDCWRGYAIDTGAEETLISWLATLDTDRLKEFVMNGKLEISDAEFSVMMPCHRSLAAQIEERKFINVSINTDYPNRCYGGMINSLVSHVQLYSDIAKVIIITKEMQHIVMNKIICRLLEEKISPTSDKLFLDEMYLWKFSGLFACGAIIDAAKILKTEDIIKAFIDEIPEHSAIASAAELPAKVQRLFDHTILKLTWSFARPESISIDILKNLYSHKKTSHFIHNQPTIEYIFDRLFQKGDTTEIKEFFDLVIRNERPNYLEFLSDLWLEKKLDALVSAGCDLSRFMDYRRTTEEGIAAMSITQKHEAALRYIKQSRALWLDKLIKSDVESKLDYEMLTIWYMGEFQEATTILYSLLAKIDVNKKIEIDRASYLLEILPGAAKSQFDQFIRYYITETGISITELAVRLNKANLVEACLAAGGNKDVKTCMRAIHWNCNISLSMILNSYKAEIINKALPMSTDQGRMSITPLEYAVISGKKQAVAMMSQYPELLRNTRVDGDRRNIIHFCIEKNIPIEIAKILLDKDPSLLAMIREGGETPLMKAINSEKMEYVDFLLLPEYLEYVNVENACKETALTQAIYNNQGSNIIFNKLLAIPSVNVNIINEECGSIFMIVCNYMLPEDTLNFILSRADLNIAEQGAEVLTKIDIILKEESDIDLYEWERLRRTIVRLGGAAGDISNLIYEGEVKSLLEEPMITDFAARQIIKRQIPALLQEIDIDQEYLVRKERKYQSIIDRLFAIYDQDSGRINRDALHGLFIEFKPKLIDDEEITINESVEYMAIKIENEIAEFIRERSRATTLTPTATLTPASAVSTSALDPEDRKRISDEELQFMKDSGAKKRHRSSGEASESTGSSPEAAASGAGSDYGGEDSVTTSPFLPITPVISPQVVAGIFTPIALGGSTAGCADSPEPECLAMTPLVKVGYSILSNFYAARDVSITPASWRARMDQKNRTRDCFSVISEAGSEISM